MEGLINKIEIEQKYGPNGKNIVQLHEKLANIPWFSKAGNSEDILDTKIEIETFSRSEGLEIIKVVPINKEELPAILKKLSGSGSLSQAYEQQVKIIEKVKRAGRTLFLANARDDQSESIFHSVFDAAFTEFGYLENEELKAICIMTMNMTELACCRELVSDQAGFETNSYLSLLKVFENGHLPLGYIDNVYYLI